MKRSIQLILLLLLGLSLFIYFSYHTIHGKRGLLAWWITYYEIQQAQVRLALLRHEYATLVNRVHLMRPDSLDPDLLEERAWTVSGMGAKGDIVIVTTTPTSPRTEAALNENGKVR